jgi:hypothetical protein
MAWLKIFIHWGFLLIQLVTVLFAVRCWNKNRQIAWKTFITAWLLTFVTETAGKIMGYYGIHNLWLYNYFDTIFYPVIILLYSLIFTRVWISWFAIISALVLFIWAAVFLFTVNAPALNTPYSLSSSVVIIFLSLTYLVRTSLDREATTPLRNDYNYWFSTGFFIYFTFSAILLGMYTTIIDSNVSWLPTFTFYANHLVTLVLHLCLWAGFRAAYKWMK